MIDMHAHWRPAELVDALRSRSTEPRIVRRDDGTEVLKSRMGGDEPLAQAFDDPQFHLAKMERLGVGTSVLSLLGSFCWIESQPVETATTLCRLVNEKRPDLKDRQWAPGDVGPLKFVSRDPLIPGTRSR